MFFTVLLFVQILTMLKFFSYSCYNFNEKVFTVYKDGGDKCEDRESSSVRV